MTTKKLTFPETTPTNAIIKPTVSIAQTVSNLCLKKTELSEEIKTLESILNDYKTKIATLKKSIQESEKLKSEYVVRNKINQANSESLFQAKNELLKYKCQLKSDYISAENAFKKKQLKFQKIISSYESEWQRALKQYNSDPYVIELSRIEGKNKDLKNQIEKIEKLRACTENEFSVFQQGLWQNFQKKVIEFSKVRMEDKSSTRLDQKPAPKIVLNTQENLKTVAGFNFFRTTIAAFNLGTYTNDANPSENPYGVDISMFDQLSIPNENLESRNEEDLFSFIQSDSNSSVNVETHEEKMDVDQISVDPNSNLDCGEEYQKQNTSGKESEYFADFIPDMENQEAWSQAQGKRFEPDQVKDVLERSKRQKTSGNEESGQEVQEEKSEENSIDGNFDYQLGFHQKQMETNQSYPEGYIETYGCQFDSRTQSASSEDISAPASEAYSPKQPSGEKPGTSSSFNQDDNFKGFSGFLGMDNDSKPSIFKLF